MSGRIIVPSLFVAAVGAVVYLLVRRRRLRQAKKNEKMLRAAAANKPRKHSTNNERNSLEYLLHAQGAHIYSVIDQLVELTSLSPLMIAKCEEARILSSSDVAKLESIPDEQEKNRMFYVLIQKHTGFYQHLLTALRETNQTRVELLLRNISV